MSRKLLLVLVVMVFAALACNAPAGGSPTDEAGAPTATSVASLATTAPQTPTVGPGDGQPTAVLPTAIPGGDPVFIGPIQFTDSASGTIGGYSFAEGIREIWAKWQYANMRDGLTIRRVWYRNGEVWVDRTVEWDFAKYGANGTVTDVSIYDRDLGLPPGEYKLELYIDGRLQDIAGNTEDGRAAFTIVASEYAPHAYPSHSGKNIANVTAGTLELMCDTCETITLAQHGEIVDVDWFFDDRHILYTVIDRSEQVSTSTIGLKWELWVVDITGGDPYRISDGEERFHDAVISPTDTFIAVAAGTGYADAGNIDLQLAFVELQNYQRKGAERYAWEFDVIPDEMRYSIYPKAAGMYALPGQWSGAAEFTAPMDFVGFEDGFDPGLYIFNVEQYTGHRIGDMP